LLAEEVGVVPEGDCTAERVGREIYSALDAMSTMSGQLA